MYKNCGTHPKIHRICSGCSDLDNEYGCPKCDYCIKCGGLDLPFSEGAPNPKGFTVNHVNRIHFPDKMLLIVEDDLFQQKRFLDWALTLFDPQGRVRVACVSNAVEAWAILQVKEIRPFAIILDHDLQWGSGSELLALMHEHLIKIPVITASGIPANNQRMYGAGAEYVYIKDQVIAGMADEIVLKLADI